MWTRAPVERCPLRCVCPQRSPNRGCGTRNPATGAIATYAVPVTRPLPRDPLAETTKLLVDGTNLLHALTRGPGDRQPPAAVIGRLRAAIPSETAITLVFDGPTEPGV